MENKSDFVFVPKIMDKEDQVKSEEFLNLLMHKQMRIYAFILSVIRNFEDADDVFQDTVNTMWQKYPESRPIGDFAAWGIQVAYYKILEYRKKQKRNVHVHFDSELFEKVLTAAKSVHLDYDDRIDKLKKCLKKLGPRGRKIIELRYYQDLKPQQISELLGLSVLNVYKIMSRLHGQLVQCVETLQRQV